MTDIVDMLFTGVEWFYDNLFYALPGTMRVLAFSILIGTLGYVAARRKGKKWIAARALIMIFTLCWAVWKCGALSLMSAGDQAWQMVGIVLLIVVLLFKFYFSSLRIWGYKVFQYWTLWIFFLVAMVFHMILDYDAVAIVHAIVFAGMMVGLIFLNKATGGTRIR